MTATLTKPQLTALLAVLQLGAPWLQTARAAERAGVGVATTWTFTPAGLTTRSEFGAGEIGWDRVEDLRRTPDVVAMLWRPQRCATGFGVQVLDDAQFARVSQWWRAAGTAAPAPGPAARASAAAAEAPAAEAADPWAGPAWDDAVVVQGPMTMPAMRRMLFEMVPRPARVVIAVVLLVLVGQALFVGPGAWVGVLVAFAGLALIAEVVLRRGVRRLGTADSLWRATPTSLTLRTPLGRSEVPWARVDRVTERRGYLVASTRRPRVAVAMPIAGLSPEDVATVRRWAAAHGARVARVARVADTAVPPAA